MWATLAGTLLFPSSRVCVFVIVHKKIFYHYYMRGGNNNKLRILSPFFLPSRGLWFIGKR